MKNLDIKPKRDKIKQGDIAWIEYLDHLKYPQMEHPPSKPYIMHIVGWVAQITPLCVRIVTNFCEDTDRKEGYLILRSTILDMKKIADRKDAERWGEELRGTAVTRRFLEV